MRIFPEVKLQISLRNQTAIQISYELLARFIYRLLYALPMKVIVAEHVIITGLI